MRAKHVRSNPRPVFTSQISRAAMERRQNVTCGGVVFTILALVALGIFCWKAYNAHRDTTSALNAATKVCAQYLTAAQADDYNGAQVYLTPSGQYTLSAPDLKKTFDILSKTYGLWTGTSFDNAQSESIAGLDIYRCQYDLICTNGPVKVDLMVVRNYKGWLVNTMSISQ